MSTHPGTRPALRRRDFIGRVVMALAGLAVIGRPRRAEADTVPYLGEIMLFAGNFPPRGWALCNGQLLPINQNQALFSLLGTTYGGNGQTTFALPNLKDRIPVGMGEGVGLTARETGEMGGETDVTLTEAQLPIHAQHTPRASTGRSQSGVPLENGVLGSSGGSPAYTANTASVTRNSFLRPSRSVRRPKTSAPMTAPAT